MISIRWSGTAFWLLVAVLFAAQAAYTFVGLDRLLYEEIAEGIRNPFWLDHRLIYDGVSSNVGWYGLVLIVYKAFGFSAHAAKHLRLALHVVFLVSTALLLTRALGLRRAWLPLLAAGLSPTMLYFNNLGTSYGIDVELFAPILLLIVTTGDRAREGSSSLALRQYAIGVLAMVACLSYPAFLVYVPILLAVYLWITRAAGVAQMLKGLVWIAVGFLTPFAAAMAWLHNAHTWLADSSVGGAGVFRGGGSGWTLNPVDVSRAGASVMKDLFMTGNTYYFPLPQVEFSGLLGVAAAWGILVGALVVGSNWTPARVPLALAGALCLLSLTLPSLATNLAGLRRSTGIIAGLYVMVACVWASPVPAGLRAAAVWAAKLACLLLVFHHLLVFAPNVRHVSRETQTVNDPWFNRFGTPDESIRTWAHDWVLQGRPLVCPASTRCRSSEIYAAVEGYMRWNGLVERPMLMTDDDSGGVNELDIRASQTGMVRR